MHLTEHPVTGIYIIDNHAEGVDIHDFIKAELFFHHLVIDGIEIFLAAADFRFDASVLQTTRDLLINGINHLFTVTARTFYRFAQNTGAHRVKSFKTKLFQLTLKGVNTEAVGDGREYFQCFAGDTPTFIRT